MDQSPGPGPGGRPPGGRPHPRPPRHGGRYDPRRDPRRRRRPRHTPPPLPPPEHGIRVQEMGTTWWGGRWVEALLAFGAQYVARLSRGQSYAREGRVHDLTVANGAVVAHVTGSRPTPYRVRLALTPLPDRVWRQAIRAMATKARFTAALLGGEMPREIDEAFASARASLFPLQLHELHTRCTCPDEAVPCKHIAAVHYVLAEAFDRDPFLLFELRGRSKASVLASLRDRRAGGPAPRGGTPAAARGTAAPVTGEAYDTFRAPVDDLHFRIVPPAASGAVLRRLGPPPGWGLGADLVSLVQPALARAAAAAQAIATDLPAPAKAARGARPTGKPGEASDPA